MIQRAWRHAATALLLVFSGLQVQAAELPLEKLTLPPGFTIELLARVPNARQMAWAPAANDGGVLYVGSMQDGKVHALEIDANYRAGKLHVIASGLSRPVGVAWRQGSLYVSAVNRILRLDNIGAQLAKPPAPVVVRDDLPRDGSHGWKFIAFGPDGWLYVPVGAPCNICKPDPDRYATILRMQPDGSKLETFARGVRNTVGFDWHPGTKALWFTENGRDMLGDDLPPDELNHAPRAGMHFGYPYCHGGTLPDPEFGSERPCSEFTPPAQTLGPHVASLGMRFYTGTQFPATYRGQVFIAEHGSWNRSRRIGYRISMVTLNGDRSTGYTPFVTGWLQDESAWGRPADVLVAPDGSLLVSDDQAGAIYRIRYGGAVR
ncbi:PQQ-dependent sugar dehydrogenase [Aquabacterium sp.]|uniref:PQQ-dependent sugar dehydrogenase n=1 Tax=Aquabacterium sp. TaxID=1872578 RepID=UPI002CE94BE8|nr:PQQ-dependent sugar dehydrogenase [Aquabacterium sp.]HSW06867.1 PQQ-dependent sugar dehydrogenase [Aquabacterium sp.]